MRMVSAATHGAVETGTSGGDEIARVWDALRDLPDPEIPVVSLINLGIVRDVRRDDDGLVVSITPTYSGCPATDLIAAEVRIALDKAGFADARVETVLSPAWTTDWIDEEGRRKLKAYGIAPPLEAKADKRALAGEARIVACPNCGSLATEMVSPFGSTPCKAHFKCTECLEPFDYFKCL